MNDIKWTVDGVPVIVFNEYTDGDKTSYLVKKVYLSDIKEPEVRGDLFCEYKLYNTKPRSWAERDHETLQIESANLNNKITKLRLDVIREQRQLSMYKNMILTCKNIINDYGDTNSNTIANVLTGKFKYIVYKISQNNILVQSIDTIHDDDGSSKMLSIHGKHNRISFHLNQYSDGSGNDRECNYFESVIHALLYIENKIEISPFIGTYQDLIKTYEHYHIDVPTHLHDKLYEINNTAINDSIINLRQRYEAELKILNNKKARLTK